MQKQNEVLVWHCLAIVATPVNYGWSPPTPYMTLEGGFEICRTAVCEGHGAAIAMTSWEFLRFVLLHTLLLTLIVSVVCGLHGGNDVKGSVRGWCTRCYA